MDDDLFKSYFEVRKIRGREEFHIYKNYNADLPRNRLELFFELFFDNQTLQNKDDANSSDIRAAGNVVYGVKDFHKSYELYSRSVQYALYDGENYATALANRSAVLYSTYEFRACIKDIDLCLKAKCLNTLRPKVLLRKAKCLTSLGRITEMKTVLKETLKCLDNTPELSSEFVDKIVTPLQEAKSNFL